MKKKFDYSKEETLDAVFNYLTMLNKGLKNRQLALGNDEELVECLLPDQVALDISAEVKKSTGSLSIEITWDVPPSEEAKMHAEEKAEKEARKQAKEDKKRLKEAEKAAAEAEKKARKESEKAEKEALKAKEKAEKEALKAKEKAEKEALKAKEKAEKEAVAV
ncbi:MAG: amphi-Trp domain-containing protein, partial [Proteobacteria bacterium]|nr:amphi-Trp domain-containing protein [Pseudomonadota bacterium]